MSDFQKIPLPGGLKQNKSISCISGNPGSRCRQGWPLARPFSLACRWYPLAVPLRGPSCACSPVHASTSSSFKGTSWIDLGRTSVASFSLNHVSEGLTSRWSHMLRCWGWGSGLRLDFGSSREDTPTRSLPLPSSHILSDGDPRIPCPAGSQPPSKE